MENKKIIELLGDKADYLLNHTCTTIDKETSNNPNTSIGVLLHGEQAGAYLKGTIKNLKSGSEKLDEDLEAVQHSFLLRCFFRKKAKALQKKLVKQ